MENFGLKGKGSQKVLLSDHKGHVVLHFDEPVEWVALQPEVARNLAEAMSRSAYKANFGDTPTPVRKSNLAEQARVKLVNRVTLIVRSMRATGDEDKVIATSVVDACMNELA